MTLELLKEALLKGHIALLCKDIWSILRAGVVRIKSAIL